MTRLTPLPVSAGLMHNALHLPLRLHPDRMILDADLLAGLWLADSQVVFLGPEGGSFAYRVDDEGREQIRLDFGAWVPADSIQLTSWHADVFRLIRAALDLM